METELIEEASKLTSLMCTLTTGGIHRSIIRVSRMTYKNIIMRLNTARDV